MTRLVTYVCTYKRNEPLVRLLESLQVAADAVETQADVGVVIVDDNPDGRAKAVVEAFDHRFSLGLHYQHVGSQNISIARNVGLETASGLGEWVAMTDDDIVVPPDWFDRHLSLQARHDADATTGPLLLRFPDDGPSWLRDEPFDRFGLLDFEDDEQVPICATGNSMIRSSFLLENPDIRFDPELGVLGGEDMVFYRAAVGRGLRCFFSTEVAVWEIEPDERATYRFQLGRALWMGNTEFVTNFRAGDATRFRLLLRGGRRCFRALGHPLRRMAAGKRPQLRFTSALVAEGLGMMSGVIGVRLDHHAIE